MTVSNAPTKNPWLIVLSAVVIHVSIGSAYAYSVFKVPLAEALGWSSTQTSLAFTLAIFFLGLSAAVFGPFVERRGPRASALLAAVLFASGHVLAGIGVATGSLWLFFLGYGVVGGIGLGIGYISPVSTLVAWFPHRRGMATGMAVLGFGAGALLASPVAARLIETVGLPRTFFVLGAVFLVLMASGAAYIAKPPAGWTPAGAATGTTRTRTTADLAQLNAREALRTPRFWMLWTMMFINISAGIMLISVASPLAQEQVGMTAVAAAAMVGLMGLFNGAGRIGWASISDYLGRENIFLLFFAVQLVAFLILPTTSSALLFQVLLFTVLTMYGGGFASLPAFIGDLFGTKQLAAIHGLLLTAWSMAGVVGPMVVAFVRDRTGGYEAAFPIFATLLALALVTSLAMKANVRSIRGRKAVVLAEG
jgi:OFA family oxalate/formate antiporter-like MFS transporter